MPHRSISATSVFLVAICVSVKRNIGACRALGSHRREEARTVERRRNSSRTGGLFRIATVHGLLKWESVLSSSSGRHGNGRRIDRPEIGTTADQAFGRGVHAPRRLRWDATCPPGRRSIPRDESEAQDWPDDSPDVVFCPNLAVAAEISPSPEATNDPSTGLGRDVVEREIRQMQGMSGGPATRHPVGDAPVSRVRTCSLRRT